MGGFGSGRCYRPRNMPFRFKKQLIGRVPRLSIPELVKRAKADPDSYFTWANGKLYVFNDFIRVEANGAYSIIKLEAKPCYYGGVRYFGFCPECEKRVTSLYLHTLGFSCRKCLNLTYWSQNVSLSKRLYQKMKKVGERIKGDRWNKPKWMRQKTFARLRSDHFDLDEKEQLADFFALRTHAQVNMAFEDCPLAIIAIERFCMEHGFM
jgi:hypothetical protein